MRYKLLKKYFLFGTTACLMLGIYSANYISAKETKVKEVVSSYLDPYDINNYKRSVSFSGYDFKVKDSSISSTGTLGPANNIFSDSENDVYIDENGKLVLTLKNNEGNWTATEVISEDNFGYGKYIFKIESRIDLIDKNVIFSPFLYKDDENEIDIEFSDFGDANTHFVVQPGRKPGNLKTYNAVLNGSYTSYVIDYRPDYIKFESYHGHNIENKRNMIESWTYTGEDIPDPIDMRLRFNVYLNEGNEPSNKKPVKIVITNFEYQE